MYFSIIVLIAGNTLAFLSVAFGVSGATATMELLPAHLLDMWGLVAKDGGKHVIACENCLDLLARGIAWAREDVEWAKM